MAATSACGPLLQAIDKAESDQGCDELKRMLATDIWVAILQHATGDWGEHPLWLASDRGLPTAVRVLLEHGAKVNLPRNNGVTALSAAAARGNAEIVDILLEHGAHVTAQTESGDSPLHYAAREGHIEVIRHLLRRGADRTVHNKEGVTPEECARRKQKVEAADIIRDFIPWVCAQPVQTPLQGRVDELGSEVERLRGELAVANERMLKANEHRDSFMFKLCAARDAEQAERSLCAHQTTRLQSAHQLLELRSADLEATRAALVTVNAQLMAKEHQLTASERRIHHITRDRDDNRQQIERVRADLMTANEALLVAQSEAVEASRREESLRRDCQNMRNSIWTLNERLAKHDAEIAAALANCAQLEQRATIAEQQRTRATTARDEAIQDRDLALTQKRQAVRECEEAEARAKLAEEERDTETRLADQRTITYQESEARLRQVTDAKTIAERRATDAETMYETCKQAMDTMQIQLANVARAEPLITDLIPGEEVLGRGAVGEVRRGIWQSERVAVKRLFALAGAYGALTRDENTWVQRELRREIDALTRLRSPYLVQFYGYTCDNRGNLDSIVLELLEPVSRDKAYHSWRYFLLCTARALRHLHGRRIIHRDLKLTNVLYDAAKNVYKLSDFGESKVIDRITARQTGGHRGTPVYMAPEIRLSVEGDEPTSAADIFSFGVLLIEVRTNAAPDPTAEFRRVPGRADPEQVAEVQRRARDLRGMPRDAADHTALAVRCLSMNPGERPLIAECEAAFRVQEAPEAHRRRPYRPA